MLKRIQYTISRGPNTGFINLMGSADCHSTFDFCGVFIGEADLVPWLMFGLAGSGARGRRYGDGPHTSLTKGIPPRD